MKKLKKLQLLSKQSGDTTMTSKQTTQQSALQLIKKPIIPAIFIVFSLLTPGSGFAAEFAGTLDRVSITDAEGTNIPPTASFTYTVNDTNVTFDASSSIDSDGSIVEYKWELGDGTTKNGLTTNHQYADMSDKTITLTLIDNHNAISITQQPLELLPPLDVSISFQPAGAEIPIDFIVDNGTAFNVTQGYGWTTPAASWGLADRNSSLSPSQAYDTFIYVSPTAVWEYDIPNGTYRITVCVGDANRAWSTNNIQLEDSPFIINGKFTDDNRWIEKSDNVVVTDGRLTMTFEGSIKTSELAWISISK